MTDMTSGTGHGHTGGSDERRGDEPVPEVVDHADQDLIVVTEYLDVVTFELNLVSAVYRVEPSELLELTKLTIEDADGVADRLEATFESRGVRAGEPGAPEADGTAIGSILRALRLLIMQDHGGWTPTMGKNRYVANVTTAGEPSHGAPPKHIQASGEPSHGAPPKRGVVRIAGEVSHGGASGPQPHSPATINEANHGRGAGVRVGVLDSAIRRHPALDEGMLAREAHVLAADDSGGPRHPSAGHATFIAGLILGQAPDATVEARAVLDDEGMADSWQVAEEIVRFGRSGVDVLNLSFVCFTDDNAPPLVLQRAIEKLDSSVVVVAAAGNHGNAEGDTGPYEIGKRPAWPAALDGVVAVGALDGEQVAPFTPDAHWIDVLVPGTNLVSTYLDGPVDTGDAEPEGTPFEGWASWSGTSFAAATVTGAIAAHTVPGQISARAGMVLVWKPDGTTQPPRAALPPSYT